jgi:hypothetical protein
VEQVGQIKKVLGLRSSQSSQNPHNTLKVQTNFSISRDYWRVQLASPIGLGDEVAVKVMGYFGFEEKDGNPHLTAEVVRG